MPTDLDALHQHAQQRGFRRWVAVAIGLVGAIPAIAVAAIPAPPSDPKFLVAALLVFGVTALLLVWTYRDREGRAARELTMWLNSVRRAAANTNVGLPFDELPDTPPTADMRNADFISLAAEYREVLEPLVVNQRALGIRIAIYRFWYPVLALALAVVVLIIVGGLALVAPR